MQGLVFRFASLTLAVFWIAGCALFPGRETPPAKPPATLPAPPAVEITPPEPAITGDLLPPPKPRKNRRITPTDSAPVAAAPSAPATVWDTFRDYAQLDLELDNARIREQRNWHIRNSRHLKLVLAQAEPYYYYVQTEAIRRGLPAELALIPIIESGYNPAARGRGPAGLWQLMPGTAKSLGVRQSSWYEGRFDVVASTDAALRYLELLNRNFDGDWLLTLAAYNAGEATIDNAIRANRKRGLAIDYWSLNLPPVTRHYIPKILALGQLIDDPARYQFDLNPIPNRPYFTTVDTQSQLDLNEAARMAGISLNELRRLNPAFRGSATDLLGPHRLLIPVAQADGFRQTLASVPVNKRMQWDQYTIRSGDSVSTIARRFNISPAELKTINHMTSDRLQAGKTLLVPHGSQRPPAVASAKATTPAAVAQAPAPAGKTRQLHKVAAGESLWVIAKQYNVGIKTLAQWNGLAPNAQLKAGHQLVIWIP
ncbi:MAG: LysM peptidoglycan-binding domain-containing protein [Gammaproteobacteria bacterium]|nr:LysM peptidoglycan-binding domain-containing protein [Gammaproteobacteria bacterium]